MSWMKLFSAAIVIAALLYKIREKSMAESPMPELDPDPWWGPGEREKGDDSVRNFKIAISNQDLDDLKARLSLPLRLTPPLENANFTYGMNQNTLKEIVQHWRLKYDWRKREALLNYYPHFMTKIEGLDIHFMRGSAQTKGAKNIKVLPLLLIHGWPGTFVEFYDIMPLLTTPQEDSNVVFEVICPSIPGYGFSQGSAKQGLSHLETAQIFLKLMKRLGYDQFYLQGGDWGSIIATSMATMYPENILGIHLNMFVANSLGPNLKLILGAILPAGIVVSHEDQEKLYPLTEKFGMFARETGYLHIQATKPDTIGAALNQSPVSLAAYIMEKFSSWTHRDNYKEVNGGLLHKHFPIDIDKILDNICIYWFTGSITTSVRYYAENFSPKALANNLDSIPCRVPSAMSAFPHDLLNQPKNFIAHKFYDIVSYSDQLVGGHFAAMERPKLLARDFHQFVNTVETREN